jgi:glycosyltransferase involved in cell wall biosynthesis
MHQDLVSIITPSYNCAKFVEEMIRSVQAQTYSNWELLFQDDCSTDETRQIVERFAADDERVKYECNAHNSGAAIARNNALRRAKGKWIAFLDSDDLWLPEKLERQVRFMEVNGFHFTYTCYSEIDGLSKETGKIVTGPMRVTKKRFLLYNWVGCLTVMYNREFIGLVQIEDVRKNNDYALWLKVGARTDCHLLKECLAKYRRGRSDSIRTSNRFFLLKWYYKLFYVAEGFCPLVSVILVVLNMICGCYKKLVYEQKIKRVG